MTIIKQATRSLFPKEPPRPARGRRAGMSALSQLMALACALTPLAAMIQAIRETA